jgi:cell wall-associated NlpC family hydrolase
MMPEIAPSEAGPGALILFRMAPRAIATHVGILTESDRFIHAYERLGVVEETLTTAWRRRVAFAFLFPHPSSI